MALRGTLLLSVHPTHVAAIRLPQNDESVAIIEELLGIQILDAYHACGFSITWPLSTRLIQKTRCTFVNLGRATRETVTLEVFRGTISPHTHTKAKLTQHFLHNSFTI